MIKRLKVSRFRSLGKDVTVDFGPLTVLVGQNGAGKSNTIDALVFLADCMHIGLEGAITKRHGMRAIRHAGSKGHPFDVAIRVEATANDAEALYRGTASRTTASSASTRGSRAWSSRCRRVSGSALPTFTRR